MRLLASWASCALLLGPVGSAAAEEMVLSCELDAGTHWELSVDLDARTLKSPIGPPVEITHHNRGWIVAQTANAYAAASETRSGDFATVQSWTINRLTGDLWASYFLGTSSAEAPVVKRTFSGHCG